MTFVQWLHDQEKRDDQVGKFAQFWRDLSDKPRLSSPASIQKHLGERGLLADVEGLANGLTSTIAEYREQMQLSVAGQSAALEASLQRHPSSSGQVRPPAGDFVERYVQALAMVNHKLDLICRALGIKGGLEPDQAVIIPAHEPIDWQGLWDESEHAEQA